MSEAGTTRARVPTDDAALREALTRLPVSKAAGEVAKKLGLDRRTLYDRANELKGEREA